MNEFDVKVISLVAIVVLVGVVVVVWLVRKKVSDVSVQAGGVKAKVKTHKPQVTTVSNVEQHAEDGDNDAAIRSNVTEVNGFVQRAKGNNSLSIGDD